MKVIILIILLLIVIISLKKNKNEKFTTNPKILYFLTDNIKLSSGIYNTNYLGIKKSIENNPDFKIVDYYTKFSRRYLKDKILIFDFTNGFNMKINPTRKEINNITPLLKHSKKNIAILHDLHARWSFNNENIDMIPFLKENNFKVIIYGHSHNTPEHQLFINNNLKYINIYHHINFNTFKNLNIKKKYDIIFIGFISKKNYPFRYRLYNLFKNKFNIININKNTPDILVKKINESQLGVVTPSKFNYFLQKYLEIPLSNCCPIGNLPKDNVLAKDLYQNDFIEILPRMNDSEIIRITEKALSNKKLLEIKSMNIRNRSQKFNSINYSKKLLETSEQI